MAGLSVKVEFDKEKFYEVIEEFKKNNPDLVMVVRCKDCKHNYDDLAGLICVKGPCVDCIVPEDFYCPYGERRSEQLEGEAQNE